jgi:hypothetical protein
MSKYSEMSRECVWPQWVENISSQRRMSIRERGKCNEDNHNSFCSPLAVTTTMWTKFEWEECNRSIIGCGTLLQARRSWLAMTTTMWTKFETEECNRSIIGCGTLLQARRSWLPLSVRSLDFQLSWSFHPHYGAGVNSAYYKKKAYQESSWGR